MRPASLPLFGEGTEPALTLPALCLWQPFASLAVDRLKPIETRKSATKFRGRFVVCATQKLAPPEMYQRVLGALEKRLPEHEVARYQPQNVPTGVVLGIVELVDCRPMTEADEPFAWVSRFTDEGKLRWAWVLSPVVVRLQPAPVSGHQYWFRVPASICIPEAA
jgi:hypothetical protein